MKQQKITLPLISVAIVSLIAGGLAWYYYSHSNPGLIFNIIPWDNTLETNWSDEFALIEIPSSIDSTSQPVYFYASQPGIPKPLVVSLHTWSGDYAQYDPLAKIVRKSGWNYIHPDFRGPNWTKDACLSKKAIADINDSIQYAKDNANVDTSNIFVVGVSGGGYATLGSYLKTKHKVRAFLSWAPISDLTAWYYQSKSRGTKYAGNILKCTSDGEDFNQQKAEERSPISWEMPEKPKGQLEIYAGINDGYTGSVPISHSIMFFNRLVKHYGYTGSVVGQADIIKLLTRSIERTKTLSTIGGREVVYKRDTKPVSLVIFDGTHEMLTEYCFNRIKQIAVRGAAVDKEKETTGVRFHRED